MEEDNRRIEKLLASGKTVRQVADATGLPRKTIEAVAQKLHRARLALWFKRTAWALGCVALLSVAAFIYHYVTYQPTDKEMYASLFKAVDGVVHAPSQPWLIEQTSLVEKDPAAAVQFFERTTARINKALSDYAGIPEVAELKRMFGNKLFTTVFIPGRGQGITRHTGTDPHPAILDNKDMLEVVFFPHSALAHPMVHNDYLSYNANWRALFVAALEFPDDTWFDAFVLHELVHGAKDRQGAISARTEFGNDLFISEELEAHAVESKVLNIATAGRYGQMTKEIAARTGGYNLRQFIARIKSQDFQMLANLFKPASTEESNLREAQFILDLTFAWFGNKYQGQELQAQKIAAYRMLVAQRGQLLR